MYIICNRHYYPLFIDDEIKVLRNCYAAGK